MSLLLFAWECTERLCVWCCEGFTVRRDVSDVPTASIFRVLTYYIAAYRQIYTASYFRRMKCWFISVCWPWLPAVQLAPIVLTAHLDPCSIKSVAGTGPHYDMPYHVSTQGYQNIHSTAGMCHKVLVTCVHATWCNWCVYIGWKQAWDTATW
jgi:hypothetical protein